MGVSGQLHASTALPPRKEHQVSIRLEAGWAPEVGRQHLLGYNLTMQETAESLRKRLCS